MGPASQIRPQVPDTPIVWTTAMAGVTVLLLLLFTSFFSSNGGHLRSTRMQESTETAATIDLSAITLQDHRYKLRHNDMYDFYFFTEVTDKFLGPHGDNFLDSTGTMMATELQFAAGIYAICCMYLCCMHYILPCSVLSSTISSYYILKFYSIAAQMKKALASKKSCNVIDVGSNFGYFSLLALKLGCTVYLLEPDLKNYELSLLNFKINGFQRYKAYNRPGGKGMVKFDGWSSMSENIGTYTLYTLIYPYISSIPLHTHSSPSPLHSYSLT